MAIEITDFRTYQKNSLQGFLTLRMTSVGLEIRDIALHQKNGKHWLQLPAKPYKKPDGSQGWAYILAFYDKHTFKKFQEVTLKALDAFQRQAGRNVNGRTT
ncbi:MAG: hypothetical protein JW883_12480 [Deltaproteobacteria bacterium]|nr:hypothetical protein [Deltaproteobacteria bacterium]